MLIERLAAIVEGLAGDDPHRTLNAALRARFDFRSTAKQEPGRPLLLVGQPGAGKTSSAAKLAALARTQDRAVTLITCDLAKAGAVEQLAIYAKALSVPAFRAKDPDSLRRAIERAGTGGLIVIDSTGSNPFDPAELQALQELAEAAAAEPILVQACGGDPGEAGELAQCYAEIGVKRLIGTRLDASRRLGGILSAADRGRLAFADFGVSPEIASALVPAQAAFLCERLLQEGPLGNGGVLASSLENSSAARGNNPGIAE
jgi:flagellar biosynthesis protein FlhF